MAFGPQYEEVDDGAGGTMIQVNYTTKGSANFRKWYNCQICGFSYPEDEVVVDESGAAYCLRFDHYLEVDKKSAAEITGEYT